MIVFRCSRLIVRVIKAAHVGTLDLSEVVCSYCGRYGHLRNECPYLLFFTEMQMVLIVQSVEINCMNILSKQNGLGFVL